MKNPSIASDSTVSEGQIETCVTLITDATRKGTGTALRELAKNGVLNKQNIERVRARGNEVVAAITALVKEKFAEIAENIAGIVRLISGAETLTLDPTDGTQTISEAGELFVGDNIDNDFKRWGLNVTSAPTKAQDVQVHEMIKDGTFAQIFGGMSTDLNSLCLTQSQIIQFVKKYHKWLCTEGLGTFFLFKNPRDENSIFVAGVSFNDGEQLMVCVFHSLYDDVWYAVSRHRIVVPQLTTVN